MWAGTTCGVGAPLHTGNLPWQHANDDWLNSMAPESRRRATPVQVLCEDQSGTYQLPFTCHFADGQWHNHESGGMVEATVVGWRMPRLQSAK